MNVGSENMDMMDISSPDLEQFVGEIKDKELMAEGIYRISAKHEDGPWVEYLLVCEETPWISMVAKKYGEHFQDVYLYRTGDSYSGHLIIEYEMYRHMIRNKIKLPQGISLNEIAHFAAECHPEYFGWYPVPLHTPNGLTVRHRDMDNGIYWLETDTGVEFLSVCYIIWEGMLSRFAMKLGKRIHPNHKSADYMFFTKNDACIPMYELLGQHSKWEGKILNKSALMNAICNNFPDYMILNNLYVQSGTNEKLLSNALNIDCHPTYEEVMEHMVVSEPDAGEQYFLWD